MKDKIKQKFKMFLGNMLPETPETPALGNR